MDKWQKVQASNGSTSVNLLEAFYRDPSRFAYTFQNYVFLTRLVQVWPHRKFCIVCLLYKNSCCQISRAWPKQSHDCDNDLSCVCCVSPVLQLYTLSSFQGHEAGSVSRYGQDVCLICCNAYKARESEDSGAALRLLERSVFSDRMVFVRAAHEAKWLSDMELSIYESWYACLYVVIL